MAHEKILVVDDDSNNVRLWSKILELSGYQVYPFTSSEKALEFLNQHEIDLVLADIRMPVIDGFELLQRSRSMHPLLPFILMTVYGTLDMAVEALQKEANGLILKPFPPYKQQIQSIRNVLDQSYQKQEIVQAQVLQPILEASVEFPEASDLQTLYQTLLDRILRCLAADSAALLSYSPKMDEFVTLGSRGIIDFFALGNHARHQLQKENSEPAIISLSTQHGTIKKQKSAILTSVFRENEFFLFWAEKSSNVEPFKQKDIDVFLIIIRQWVLSLSNAKLTSKVKDLMSGEPNVQKNLAPHQVRESGIYGEISPGSSLTLQDKGIIFNHLQRFVQFRNQRIHLTPSEAKFLTSMMAECGCVIPHEKLVLAIHGYQPETGEASAILRPLVSRLKKKLAAFTGNLIQIRNIRGDGYLLEILRNDISRHPGSS